MKAKNYVGLMIYKQDSHNKGGVYIEYKFFPNVADREKYVLQYILNRPSNAKKVLDMKRFDATFQNMK